MSFCSMSFYYNANKGKTKNKKQKTQFPAGATVYVEFVHSPHICGFSPSTLVSLDIPQMCTLG